MFTQAITFSTVGLPLTSWTFTFELLQLTWSLKLLQFQQWCDGRQLIPCATCHNPTKPLSHGRLQHPIVLLTQISHSELQILQVKNGMLPLSPAPHLLLWDTSSLWHFWNAIPPHKLEMGAVASVLSLWCLFLYRWWLESPYVYEGLTRMV